MTNLGEQLKYASEHTEEIDQRLAVKKFAGAMELKLQRNDHKGGWGKGLCTISYLRDRLIDELDEYIHTLDDTELVDIANFAMMLWNRQKDTQAFQ